MAHGSYGARIEMLSQLLLSNTARALITRNQLNLEFNELREPLKISVGIGKTVWKATFDLKAVLRSFKKQIDDEIEFQLEAEKNRLALEHRAHTTGILPPPHFNAGRLLIRPTAHAVAVEVLRQLCKVADVPSNLKPVPVRTRKLRASRRSRRRAS